MKEDLKRLINEFVKETREHRTEKVSTQLTDKMKEDYKYVRREPTLQDFIEWLNNEIPYDK